MESFTANQLIKKQQQIQKGKNKYDKKVAELQKKFVVYTKQLEKQVKKYEKKYHHKHALLLKKMETKKQKYNFDQQIRDFKAFSQEKLAEIKLTKNNKEYSIAQNRYHFFSSLKQQNKIKTIQTINDYYKKKIDQLNSQREIAIKNFELIKEDLEKGNKVTLDRFYTSVVESVYIKWEKKEFKLLYKTSHQKIITDLKMIRDKKSTEYINKKFELSQLVFNLYEQQEWKWSPFRVRLLQYKINALNSSYNNWQKFKQTIILVKNYSLKDWINIKVWEIPLYLLVLMAAVVIVAIAINSLSVNMISALAVLFVIAAIGGTIFNKIPIWNKYVGGGLLGVMFVGAILVATNVIAKGSNTYNVIDTWFSKQDFLSLYICVLLVGSVLSIPRKMIIKAMSGFLSMIIIACAFATGLALLFGTITGHSVSDIILNYLLPTLSDGNGGGVQPMAKIAAANGYDYNTWISGALAISTLSSVFSVIAGAILNGVGKSKHSLTGEGRLMQREIHVVEEKVNPTDRNVAGGLILVTTLFVLSDIVAKKILPQSVIGVNIPNFAWMIIICLILNLLNIIPASIKAGTAKLNSFVAKQMTWLLMLGVGIIDLDLTKFVQALNPASLLICLGIVIGVVAGPMIFARLISFYQIESAISAGLCMSAQGGAGAIAVLGASNRMELMAYAQITCRIAGSLVLVVASFAFSAWPGPMGH